MMYPDLDKVAEQFPAPCSKARPNAFLKMAAMLVVGVTLYFLFDLGSKPVAVGLIPSPWDKLAHAILFAFLAFVGGYLASILDLQRRWLYVLTFLVAASFGLFDELHQLKLPGRQFDWIDLLSDAIGAAAGVLALARSRLAEPAIDTVPAAVADD